MEKDKKQGMPDEDFLSAQDRIETRLDTTIAVGGKIYRVKQISKKARLKIDKLNREMYWCEQRSKEKISLREAKKIAKCINSVHAKIAAYYLLGLKAFLIPFAFAITWRKLMYRTDEEVFAINEAGANDPQLAFFLNNCQITSSQLVLSMNLVGNSVKQWQERMASAESMLEKDALPKKKQGSK